MTYMPFILSPKVIRPVRPERQILSPIYIRKLIDRHYKLSYLYLHLTVGKMTIFLQRNYSPHITCDMVEEALDLEPTIQFRGKINRLFMLYE